MKNNNKGIHMNDGGQHIAQLVTAPPLNQPTNNLKVLETPPPVDISIVFPAYNEEDNVCLLIEEIQAAVTPLGRRYEIIAVDDYSSDQTLDRLKKLRSNHYDLHLLSFRKNVGQTSALMAGLREARGNIIVTLDADRQNDPADIPALLAILKQPGVDVVSGWRHKRKDGWLFRKLPSMLANVVVRAVTGTRIHDLGCSLKAYRREVIEFLHLYGEMHRFIIPLVEQMGARVSEVRVNHRPRTTGQSKYGLNRAYKVIIDLVTVWFIGGFQQRPSALFGGIGLILWIFSGLFFTATLWQRIVYDGWVHKNPLFACGIFFGVGGIQLFATGLLSELIIRTYYEATNKTTHPIRERTSLYSSIGAPEHPPPLGDETEIRPGYRKLIEP